MTREQADDEFLPTLQQQLERDLPQKALQNPNIERSRHSEGGVMYNNWLDFFDDLEQLAEEYQEEELLKTIRELRPAALGKIQERYMCTIAGAFWADGKAAAYWIARVVELSRIDQDDPRRRAAFENLARKIYTSAGKYGRYDPLIPHT